MKYLLLSDIHFSDKQPIGRDDDIYQAGLEKLDIIFNHACSEQTPILHSGDLFHTPENWNRKKTETAKLWKPFNDVIKLFNKYEWLKGKFYCVYGQHDMYKMNKNDTCLNTLENIGYVQILKQSSTLYGVSWGDELPKKMLKDAILVIHKSISNSDTVFDTISAKDFIDGFTNTFVLCGDIHKRFIVDGGNNSRIINTGPIIRRSVEEKDHKPCCAILDTITGGLEWHFLPDRGVFSEEHIALKNEQERSKINLKEYIESLGKFKKTADFKENLIYMLKNIDDEPVKEKIESYLK